MLVVLGFLLATLIALVLAPVYRARAMRLTYKHIRRVLPLTDGELVVDRDRLRAQYAIRIHDLETKLEKARLTAARQQVDVNRRDATITALETELTQLRSDLEQNVNARRVLEQTVMDRLPAVEQRLTETRSLLEQRDRELAAVTAETGKTVRALDEVMQINAQQRAEIERLNGIIASRGLRSRVGARDSRFESEVALRSELEALRAKTREQESLIARLQTLVTTPSEPGRLARANGNGAAHDQEIELERLRRDLAEAESALKSVSEHADANGAADETARARLQSLDNLVEKQASKIRQLEAALAAYEKGGGDGRSMLKDSKIAMKARIASLQAEVEDRTATVEKLRAELASANERLALQSAQFRDEMRRLRTAAPAAERADEKASVRRSLAARITEANPALAASLRSGPMRSTARQSDDTNAREASPQLPDGAGEPVDRANGKTVSHEAAKDSGKPAEPAPAESDRPDADAQSQSRLLDRIASISKS